MHVLCTSVELVGKEELLLWYFCYSEGFELYAVVMFTLYERKSAIMPESSWQRTKEEPLLVHVFRSSKRLSDDVTLVFLAAWQVSPWWVCAWQVSTTCVQFSSDPSPVTGRKVGARPIHRGSRACRLEDNGLRLERAAAESVAEVRIIDSPCWDYGWKTDTNYLIFWLLYSIGYEYDILSLV